MDTRVGWPCTICAASSMRLLFDCSSHTCRFFFLGHKHPTIFIDCIFIATVNLSLGTVHPCTPRDAAPTPTLVHWGSGCQSMFKGKRHSHQPTMTGLLLVLVLLLPSFLPSLPPESVCFCSLPQSNLDTHLPADWPYSQYPSTCSVM